MISQAINSALSGMQRQQADLAYHADRIARWGLPGAEGEGEDIDLTAEMVGVLQARRGFEANLPVIRAADEMLGQLIDTFA